MLPLLLSIAGGLAGPIASAIAGSKTEEEARKLVRPKYDALVTRLLGEGLGHVEAKRMADEAIAPEIERVRSEGALPGWAEAALGVAGGIGGWAAGAKLAGKAAAKALAKGAVKAAPSEVKAIAKVGESALEKKAGTPIPKAPQTMEMEPVKRPVKGMMPDDGKDLDQMEMLSAFPKGAVEKRLPKAMTEELSEGQPISMMGDNEAMEAGKMLGAFPKKRNSMMEMIASNALPS